MRIKYYSCFQLLPHGNSSRLPSCIDICSWAHSGGGVRRLLCEVVPRGVVIIDHSMNGALWAPSLSSGTLLICMGLSPAGLSAHCIVLCTLCRTSSWSVVELPLVERLLVFLNFREPTCVFIFLTQV